MGDQQQHTNRLAQETSPYLLQHAHNPVDWYAWGPEAFEAARAQDKPIFLSVGYSTCYWCHVMERECFENEQIATIMNRLFINIKVDREERPDVDQLYMTAVQLITRSGGWPMSVFLTPDLKPFYGGTYFPPDDYAGRPGFPSVLRSIHDAWLNRRAEVVGSADRLTDALRRYSVAIGSEVPVTIDEAFIDNIIGRSISDYDKLHGGFGGAPKFPRETLLQLLLSYCDAEPRDTPAKTEVARMLTHTLDQMARGGMRDQLGGGFHRYSTDERWLVPHFEIMLYDNAMLLGVYATASRLFRRPDLAEVAKGIADFVLSRMTGPSGEFYTAFDAEVNGREGGNYLWTLDQLDDVLTVEEAAVAARVWGFDAGPNFADPHHGTGTPDANVLYMPDDISYLAEALGSTPSELKNEVDVIRKKLLAARDKRPQPLLDTKVLTSWNALMIQGLAIASRELKEQGYEVAAARSAEFLLQHHAGGDGGLFRSSREAKKKIAGFLDDYAALALALCGLHNVTREQRWKNEAESLIEQIGNRFASPAGALYFSDRTSDEMIARQIVGVDSPLPSGNAQAALALLSLGHSQPAAGILKAFGDSMDSHGEAYSSMVEAAHRYVLAHGKLSVPAADVQELLEKPELQQPVMAKGLRVGSNRVEIHIRIADGFHINTATPPSGLYPTRLVLSGEPGRISFPEPNHQLRTGDGPSIGAYSGEVVITAEVQDAKAIRSAQLYAQPCSETACLPQMRIDIAID